MAQGLIASSESRVVVGLGLTGLSCARHLHRLGLPFAIVDTREQPPELPTLTAEMPEVPVYAGDIPAGLLAGASELIVSPGIAPDNALLADAVAADAAIIGDIDLFMREATAPVVGITGSNAKSTVTALVGAMARSAGIAAGVGGNLGPPALDLLDSTNELYVLELSSFQLERAGKLDLAVAAVLNISADHLDRHGSMVRYHQAKHRIFRGCRKAVVNPDDALTVPLVGPEVAVTSWRMQEPELGGFGLRNIDGAVMLCRGFDALMPVSELGIVGHHNVANALAALAIGSAAGLPEAAMLEALRNFPGLPHRCQRVACVNGVTWVNDSKGTNVGATEAALRGLGGDGNLVLIAGGQGKGADFRSLRAAVARHCRALVLIGEDAPALQAALGDCVETVHAATLESAVERAAALAHSGDTVLLSPACASFDMFSGFTARGDAFVAAVRGLEAST